MFTSRSAALNLLERLRRAEWINLIGELARDSYAARRLFEGLPGEMALDRAIDIFDELDERSLTRICEAVDSLLTDEAGLADEELSNLVDLIQMLELDVSGSALRRIVLNPRRSVKVRSDMAIALADRRPPPAEFWNDELVTKVPELLPAALFGLAKVAAPRALEFLGHWQGDPPLTSLERSLELAVRTVGWEAAARILENLDGAIVAALTDAEFESEMVRRAIDDIDLAEDDVPAGYLPGSAQAKADQSASLAYGFHRCAVGPRAKDKIEKALLRAGRRNPSMTP